MYEFNSFRIRLIILRSIRVLRHSINISWIILSMWLSHNFLSPIIFWPLHRMNKFFPIGNDKTLIMTFISIFSLILNFSWNFIFWVWITRDIDMRKRKNMFTHLIYWFLKIAYKSIFRNLIHMPWNKFCKF